MKILRAVRVEQDLWVQSGQLAHKLGTTRSALIRELLQKAIRSAKPSLDEAYKTVEAKYGDTLSELSK